VLRAEEADDGGEPSCPVIAREGRKSAEEDTNGWRWSTSREDAGRGPVGSRRVREDNYFAVKDPDHWTTAEIYFDYRGDVMAPGTKGVGGRLI